MADLVGGCRGPEESCRDWYHDQEPGRTCSMSRRDNTPITLQPPAAASWVEKSPEVCGGDARVRRTRITVWSLVQRRNWGLADAEILERLPSLTQADLDAAWT